MKKTLIALLLVVFCATMAFAAVSTERPITVLHQSTTNQQDIYTSEIHRVVTGIAAANWIAPNFYDNDWDTVSGYTRPTDFRNSVTLDEKAYLKSIPGSGFHMYKGVTYYVDMTGQVWGSSPFEDYTNENWVYNTTVQYLNIDPYTVVEMTVYDIVHYVHDVTYQIVANLYDYSPLVLDLNGDGKIDVAKNQWLPHSPKFFREYAINFDMTGDGKTEFTEWMAPSSTDGLLVKAEDGKVETALQLFGTAGGYRDGYEKLSIVCDADKNGWVEGEELNGLQIWIDENKNGICESGELKELADYNVQKLSTKHKDYVSLYVTGDGQEHKVWDWWPSSLEVRKIRN